MTCHPTRRRVLAGAAGAAASLVIAGRGFAATPARVHLITIERFKFSPVELTVRPGDTIQWINRDLSPHTATALDGSWDTGELLRGEKSKEIAVTAETSAQYFCAFHPHMVATLRIDR